MIKVLITDDHPVVRRGIRQILEDDERIDLVEEACDGKELFERLKEQLFDVILLDISLPGRSGLDLISQIKKTRQSAAILMLSIHSESMYAVKALKSGAAGYLTKSSAPRLLKSREEKDIYHHHLLMRWLKVLSPVQKSLFINYFLPGNLKF